VSGLPPHLASNLPTAGVDDHVSHGGRKGTSYGPCVQAYARKFYTTEKTAYTFVG
jgi:alpha-ketoglutaric semialdehyde dehydrogenase